MHDGSCIGINYAHKVPKCFRSLHTLLGFSLVYFASAIQFLWLQQFIQFLTCTRIPCRDSHCENGTVRCCLNTITLRNDNVQDFDTRWDEMLSSMTKTPSDDVLGSLYKERIRESDQLKKCVRFVRHGNSSEDIEAQLSEVGDDGEKEHRFGYENLTPEMRELKQEQWLRMAWGNVVLKEEKE